MHQIRFTICISAIIIMFLGYYYYQSFQKTKKEEAKRLQLLYADILYEENQKHQLKKKIKIDNQLNSDIKTKIIKIKVDVININFTLTELFN